MQESALTGGWWRAKRYELRGGYVRPAAGVAIKRYDALDDHDYHRSNRSPGYVPAYLRLARIADAVAPREARELEIVEWCAEYGLLGLLLHQVQQVRFAPRWQLPRPLSAEAKRVLTPIARAALAAKLPDGTPIKLGAARADRERLRLVQKLYQRTSSGTFLWGDEEWVAPAVPSHAAKPGNLADRAMWRLAEPGVILQHLATREWKQEPLTTWARFFPDVPEIERETHAYPMPYSDEFWAIYAEPIEQFVTAAGLLRDAFVAASGKRLRGGRPPAYEIGLGDGPFRLNALVAPAGPMLFGNSTAYEQRLIAPSLLGALALMAQLDLAGHRRFLRCRNDRCKKLFVGTTVQSAYCSPACRKAQHARSPHDHRSQAEPSR